MHRILYLLTPLLLLAGCSELGTAAGAEIDHTAAAGPLLYDAPVSLTPVGRIGCQACGDARQLSVRSIALGEGGRVYVLDRFEPFVRIFTLDGTFLGGFGRFGQGPGEIENPGYIYPTDEGVYVMDRVARRLVLYASDGSVRHEWLLDHFPYSPVYSPKTGRFVFASNHEGSTRHETAVYELTPRSDTTRRIVDFSGEFPVKGDRSPSVYYPLAIAPDGSIAVGEHSNEYRVRVFDDSGALEHECRLDIRREPKTTAEIELERATIARERFRFEPDPLKPHYFAWALAFDDASRLWVRAGRSGIDEAVFDVFAKGQYVGSVPAPGGIAEREPFAIRGQHLIASYADDDGDDIVRVFEIGAESGSRTPSEWQAGIEPR